MKVTDLKPGDRAVITVVDPQGEIGIRLVEMGLVKGAHFKFVRKAPLGDPIEIQLNGFCLALRKEEANGIEVEAIGRPECGKDKGKGCGCKGGKGSGHEK